ncbi:MAG: Xaa-Pro aminopeptidase, partial [Propionibacterium sp.]
MSQNQNDSSSSEVPVRQTPFSAAFRELIVQDWAPYSDLLPEALPAAPWAKQRREKISEKFVGETLVLPAGP